MPPFTAFCGFWCLVWASGAFYGLANLFRAGDLFSLITALQGPAEYDKIIILLINDIYIVNTET